MLIRAIKEARPLTAPAILILLTTGITLTWLPGMFPTWPRGPAIVLFHLGAAFLVTIPFGTEFQHRTLVLLLSQPETRTRLWLRKSISIGLVLTVVAGLQYAALRSGPFAMKTVGRELTFLLAVLCSATFWTLIARSTLGGVAFTLAALMVLEMAANLVVVHLFGTSLDLFFSHPFVVAVRAAYILTMLWLGWRTFSRLEVKGDGTPAGERLALDPLSRLLRCRRHGALGNLVRKELRLQAPTLQIAAVFAACWLATIGYFAVTPARPSGAETVFIVLLTVYFPLALVVSSTISLGEETTLGIRAWHLTLPVSSRVQWLVKLAVSAAVAAVLALGLPSALVMLAALAVPLPEGGLRVPAAPSALIAAGILVFGFWAATLFGHTVRAAVATGLAVVGIGIFGRIGIEAGLRLGVWDGLLTWLMIRNQWSPQAVFVGPAWFERLTVTLFVVIVAVAALGQSLRAFRRVQVGPRVIARYSGQLALASFLLTFGVASYDRAAGNQWRSAPARELRAAIEAARPAAGAARVIPLAELQATGLVSDATSRWLTGSEVTVDTRTVRWSRTAGTPTDSRLVYRVRVLFPNGQKYEPVFFLPDSRR
jgi:hypothetical protein